MRAPLRCGLPLLLLGVARADDSASFYDGTSSLLDEEQYLPPVATAPSVSSPGTTSAATATPSAAGGCKFVSGSNTFDLSPMRRTDHDFTGTTAGGYAYRFNICGDTVRTCGLQPSPASKWRGTKCNSLGDGTTQLLTLLDANDPGAGLKLSFRDGDICKRQVDGEMEMGSRQVSFEVHCDASQEPGRLRQINEVSMCEYNIIFDSAYACPIRPGGRGWSFIFLVLLAASAYLAAGYGVRARRIELGAPRLIPVRCLFSRLARLQPAAPPPLPPRAQVNHHYHGMRGAEAIPNRDFWLELPGLVRDGLAFSYVHGRYLYLAQFIALDR